MPDWLSSSVLSRLLLCTPAGIAFLFFAEPAHASEGGASFYLPSSGGPDNDMLPPVQGNFLVNRSYRYAGNASDGHEFAVGGNVVAGLKSTIAADFATIGWAQRTSILGGTMAVGGAFAEGQPYVTVNEVLTGPGSGSVEAFPSIVPGQSTELPQSAEFAQSMEPAYPASSVQPGPRFRPLRQYRER